MENAVYRKLHTFVLKYAKVGFIMFLAVMVIVSYSPLASYSSAQGSGAVFYVSTAGDDNNPGTLDKPWRTIQKAADSVSGGHTVFVRGGIYEEFVTITASGSEPEGYITFQAYPGELPVIDGTRLTIGSGKNSLIELRGANYVIVEGFELRNLSTSSDSRFPAGIRVHYGGSNIHILNNNVHHIQNLSPDGNAHGIHIYGNSLKPLTKVSVSGNEVHHLTLGSSESLTVSGNVDDFLVSDNIVHDNNNIGIDIAGFYGACSSPCTDQARNGTVAGNTVYNIDSSINPAYGSGSNSAGGIYADGATNIIIERNHVYNSDFGIEVASENKGKTTSRITVRNNFIHHNDGAGIIMGGSERLNGGASDNVIANNTLVENDQLRQGYGEITLQENNVNNQIVNNIIYAMPQKAMVYKSNTSGSGNVIDYNLYYWSDGKMPSKWKWEGQSYSSWNAYKQGTGHDAHSLFANPAFSDLGSQLITLAEGSPAIDRGLPLPTEGGSADYYGMARVQGLGIDLGASESAGEPVTATPAPSSSPDAGPETPAPTMMPSPTPLPTPTATPTSAPTATATPAPTDKPGMPSESPAPTPDGLTVDGKWEDWSSVSELTTGNSNVRSIKAAIQDQKLYVLVTGNLLGEKGQLYLNTDGDGKTGFQAPFWDGAGADYLLENGILYVYSGNGGTNWKWTEVISYKQSGAFKATSTAVEAAISLSDLGGVSSAGAVELGYVWKDSHENKLPDSKRMASFSIVHEPPPAASPVIQTDGKSDDWKSYSYLSTGANPAGLKVANDGDFLYVLIEGKSLTKKTQLYVNTDNRSDKGYKASNWKSGGAEYLLEYGRLYQYTGTGSNWSWKETMNVKSSGRYAAYDTIIEAAIPLSGLGVQAGATITLGVLLDDNKSTQLPADGDMVAYKLQK